MNMNMNEMITRDYVVINDYRIIIIIYYIIIMLDFSSIWMKFWNVELQTLQTMDSWTMDYGIMDQLRNRVDFDVVIHVD